MNVWTYWEGPRPVYIDVCLATMRRACGDGLRLVTPEDVGDYLPEGSLHPSYRELPQPALRADAVRAALLAVHGGWWWDADTVALRSPTDWPGARAVYMAWTRPPRRVLNGYLYMVPEVAATWLDVVNRKLRDGASAVDWCSLGEQLLTNWLPGVTLAEEVPRELFLPVDIDSSVATFFEPGDPAGMVDERTVCFGLNHSWFMYHRPREMNLPPSQWDASPLLVHRLLCLARSELC